MKQSITVMIQKVGNLHAMHAGVVFAFVDGVPGLLLLTYAAVWECWPGFLRLWVPLVIAVSVIACVGIEARLALAFFGDI